MVEKVKALETFSFHDKKIRKISNSNWKEQCLVLNSAIKAGYEPAQQVYSYILDRKKYAVELADCFYSSANDEKIKKIRAFWWEQLAEELEDERIALADAYRKGKLVEKLKNRAKYWEEFKKI